MTKWEYVSIALVKGIKDAGVKTQEDLLNKYGLDGWARACLRVFTCILISAIALVM
jgi:hypothetical protein